LGDLPAAQLLLQEGLHSIDSGGKQQRQRCIQLGRSAVALRSAVQQLLEDLGQQLALKEAGNRAVSSKKYDVAVEEYSKAWRLAPAVALPLSCTATVQQPTSSWSVLLGPGGLWAGRGPGPLICRGLLQVRERR